MLNHAQPLPPLPFDVRKLGAQGLVVSADVAAGGHRELLQLLEYYATIGLTELRVVNPLTRGRAEAEIVAELDAPMPHRRLFVALFRFITGPASKLEKGESWVGLEILVKSGGVLSAEPARE